MALNVGAPFIEIEREKERVKLFELLHKTIAIIELAKILVSQNHRNIESLFIFMQLKCRGVKRYIQSI